MVVIPTEFTPGWIFEQNKIDYIGKGTEKTVVLNYYPTTLAPETLKLTIASDGGKHYTEKTFQLKKETGLVGLIHYIIDNFKIIYVKGE